VLITQKDGAFVLAFLEALCRALAERDATTIRRLLEHPLAHALPRAVTDEANAILSGNVPDFVAPVQALRFYHQTAHLLGAFATSEPTRRAAAVPAATTRSAVLELALEPILAH
jgi:hypothetical protein